ncbi:MAG: helix-turn-helix domain-containing protein [Bacteroidota bacterium]|nr:helix-turn-helix domain-containing protein [Bacteroidota bacterium]
MKKVMMNQAYVENQPQRWLRSKHVRELLGISDSTLQNFRVKGIIPAYRLGDSWFYREDEIFAALEKGRTRKEGNNG